MADRFGGKWLFGSCILLSSVVSLVTPAAARIHIDLVVALRVLSGLGEGVKRPAAQALIARWTAPQYYSAVAGIIGVGGDCGVIVGLFWGGFLCDYGFAGGWPSVFYVFGMVGCVWFFCWCFLCYSSPCTHPRMPTAELEYYEKMIGTIDLARYPPTPWRKILTSVPVWALTVALLAECFLFNSLMTCLPLYMHDVLGLDMETNGALSAVPFLGLITACPVMGVIADWLRSSGRLSTTAIRKISCFAGFMLTDCFLIFVPFVGCNRALAVLNFFLIFVCNSMVFNCVITNQLDLAPLHAGKIMGMANTVANLGAIAGPIVVGVMTSRQSTRSTWQNVFFLIAGINSFGAFVFLIFGSGSRQIWAD